MADLPDDYATFKSEILNDLQYEDDQGVYEIWWAANARYPLLAVSERMRIAECVVADLLMSGEANLYRHHVMRAELRREVENASEALLEWSTWVPQSEEQVWIEPAVFYS